jgi:serine/threonine protein phosphatase PrpC
LIGEHIICSKIGDSKVILDENHKDVIPLSEEQKPKHEKEKKKNRRKRRRSQIIRR